ncbi:hypothetical protein LshimejAT787_1202680 [Lyophyllum shimeji]|uniref:Uncharacterized protein n=1 Tax=Lyophyllum shimeji TaxID=47721 RepID=A0A9P3UPI7_LYOSH|nr:hypothetical protein LshimejAT787_1202680 [Lyophyllum shimeji]
MSARPQATTSNRDSNAIRASVFDVCLQLGALDENSRVAEWMFSDPSEDSDSFPRRNRTTRFQEVISAGWEAVEEKAPQQRRRRYVLPFAIKAPVFTTRLRGRPSQQARAPETSEPTHEKPAARELGPGYVSLSRRSFFRRSIHKPPPPRPEANNARKPVCDDSGRVSTNVKTFFQRKMRCEPSKTRPQEVPPPNAELNNATSAPPSTAGPGPSIVHPAVPPQSAHDLLEDDGDDEWEEIDATPGSPLYPLPNKGINPPALHSLSDKKRHSTAGTGTTDTETGSADAEADIDIVYGATHHNLTLAFPRLIFRRASRIGSLSPQKKRAGRASPKKSHTPSPAHTPSASSTPTPTPSPGRRKPLSIITGKKAKHRRGISSSSLPPSPFVLLTQNRNSTMPQPTSRIVFPEDVPVRPLSLSEAERRSMGWHNQFFVGDAKGISEGKEQEKKLGDGDGKGMGKRPKSVSVPTPPPASKRTIGRGPRREEKPVGAPVPFPVMKEKEET